MSISSDYLSLTRSTNGMAGMVSGLDTDSLVEALLMGQQSKIDKANQSHTLYGYKQEAYRDVISTIDTFSSNYTSYSSKTSLISNSFFNQMTSSTTSSAFSVTGTSSASEGDMTLSVEALAETATFSGSQIASVENITGTLSSSLFAELGNTAVSFSVKDKNGTEQTVELNSTQISNLMNGVDVNIGLADGSTMAFSTDAGKLEISMDTGVSATVMSTTQDGSTTTSLALQQLGLTAGATSGSYETDDEDGNLTTANGFNTSIDSSAELSIDINLDGVTKSIKLSDIASYDEDGKFSLSGSITNLKEKLVGLFGDKNIIFDGDTETGAFTLSTMQGRSITVTGSEDLLKALDIDSGATNVLATGTEVGSVFGDVFDSDGTAQIVINGVGVTIDSTDTISAMIKKVNESDAGVIMSFDSFSNTFSIEAEESGAGFDMTFGTFDENGDPTGEGEDLLKALMGLEDLTASLNDVVADAQKDEDDREYSNYTQGKNAEFTLNGVSSERSSNNFTINGITFELHDTTDTTEKITTSRDIDSIIEGITSFIDDYNSMIESLNGYVNDQYDSEYPPLTDAQKDEMSETEIANWEEKAKTGVLQNDDLITDFLTAMRTAMYSTYGESGTALWQIGIEAGDDWTENGKLYIDEDVLRQTLITDPDIVQDIFTGTDGIISGVASVTKTYANTSSGSPGLLVEKAGIEGTATEHNNTLSNWMADVLDKLEALEYNYTLQSDRYWAQFNAMEVVLSQLQSQSSWLSQQFAY